VFQVQLMIDGDAAKRHGIPSQARAWITLNVKPVRRAAAERLRKNAAVDYSNAIIRVRPAAR